MKRQNWCKVGSCEDALVSLIKERSKTFIGFSTLEAHFALHDAPCAQFSICLQPISTCHV